MVLWTVELERKILMLALKQHGPISLDAETIIAELPDDDKPSARSVRQRLSQLKSQAQVLDFSTGWKNIKAEIMPGANVGAISRITPYTTPTRRPSAASKTTLGCSLSTSSPVTPTSTNDLATPDTPFTISKIRSALPAPNGNTSPKAANADNSNGLSKTKTCSTTSGNKLKPPSTNMDGFKHPASLAGINGKGKPKNKKRKANKISKSDDESTAPDTEDDTSEDEFPTPTKPGMNPTLNKTSLISDRRASHARRSKSATPAVYCTLNNDDGTGLDDAAKDVSSSEEYDVNEDKRGKKMTPSGKRIGWRERVGESED